MKKVTLIIFDLNNIQEHYAYCLELIEMFENLKDINIDSKTFDRLLQQGFSIKILQNYNYIIPRWIEEEMIQTNAVKKYKIPAAVDLADKINLINELKISGNNNPFYYHIRVNIFNELKILNLSYLTMLINKINFINEEREKKINFSVFIDQMENKNDCYEQLSQFMRLITKANNSTIFAKKYDENVSCSVKALNFETKYNFSNRSFPLIWVDKDKYNKLFDDINNDSLITKDKSKFREYIIGASDENPDAALVPFLMEFSIKYINSIVEKSSDPTASDKMIKSFLLEKNNITNIFKNKFNLLKLCLFSVLIEHTGNVNENGLAFTENSLKNAYIISNEIEMGLRQLIQNSIQHSQYKSCVLYFGVINVKDNYKLEILTADLNDEQTVIDSFIANCKKTIEAGNASDALKNLIQKEDAFKLGDFLCEFDSKSSNIDEWFEYRQSDTAGHIGLGLFNNTMKRCGGDCHIMSCKTYNPTALIKNNEVSSIIWRNIYVKFQAKESIPGTQVYIAIPIMQIKFPEVVNLAQLGNGQSFSENYEAYSKFLDFRKKQIEIGSRFDLYWSAAKERDVTDADQKTELYMKIFKEFWLDILLKPADIQTGKSGYLEFDKTLYSIDFKEHSDYLKDFDFCEVMVKGLYSAFDFIRKDNKLQNVEMYFEIKNVRKVFSEAFRKVSTVLSLKPFPSNLQMLISELSTDILQENDLIPITNYIMVGEMTGFAVQNSYVLALEHGIDNVSGFEGSDIFATYNLMKPFSDNINKKMKNSTPISVIPFTAIHGQPDNELLSMDYFIKLKGLANKSIFNEKNSGYKFLNTHTRLGNKVHIDAFYEMSFLFYRTILANRVAFEILTNLIENEKTEKIIKNENILFYGYASYSQAIIMSLTEMLKAYCKNNKKDIEYAIYQYNLQSETSPEKITVYFNNVDVLFELAKGNPGKKINVVQIVPISSTLTTFEKMYKQLLVDFNRYVLNESESNKKNCDNILNIISNYTVFWVRDESRINEREYLEESDSQNNLLIRTNAEICKEINYIIYGETNWIKPIDCKVCFPSPEQLYKERPLVETDATSTVPSQQIPLKRKKIREHDISMTFDDYVKRFSNLKDCVYYGHFMRGKNHYQYYIDTQKYFANSKLEISEWLKSERKGWITGAKDSLSEPLPFLKIIFSPEHNTNVGFSQYVNTYFFEGTAEIISINEDKEFRSNFIYEYSALKRVIQKLFDDYDFYFSKGKNILNKNNYKPVKFYFVDDTIISGETFHKSSSLLQSLIPEKFVSLYKTNVFEKCFVLINRISNSSKLVYVQEPGVNFHAFCDIHISNMRRHGDSCVGCKLKNSASNMYKRSATRSSCYYWYNKQKRHDERHFDEIEKGESKTYMGYSGIEAYSRLIISHILKNLIDQSESFEKMSNKTGSELNIILTITEFIIESVDVYDGDNPDWFLLNDLYKSLHNCYPERIAKLKMIEIVLKLMSRPFFTFDQFLKASIMQFIIIISEVILNNDDHRVINKNDANDIVLRKAEEIARKIHSEIIKDPCGADELRFVQETLFEALSDLGSTYLIRKKTIISTVKYLMRFPKNLLFNCHYFSKEKCKFNDLRECIFNKSILRCFWNSYAVNIQKVTEYNGEDSRAMWLEYLLRTGEEYNNKKHNKIKISETQNTLYDAVNGELDSLSEYSPEFDNLFKMFCTEIFLQNTKMYFEWIETFSKNGSLSYSQPYWDQIKQLTAENLNNNAESVKVQAELYNFLDKPRTDDIQIEVYYNEFCGKIKKIINDKYSINDICLSLVTLNPQYNKCDLIDSGNTLRSELYSKFDLLTFESDNSENHNPEPIAKTIIKERILKSIIKLLDWGYDVKCENKHEELYNGRNTYMIIMFDIPERTSPENQSADSMAPVFLYISYDNKNDMSAREPWLIVRDVLTQRHRIMNRLSADFNSDAISNFMHSKSKQIILSHVKAARHSPKTFYEQLSDMLSTNIIETYSNEILSEKEIYHWQLLRSYNDSQISQIFNRVIEMLCGDKVDNNTDNDVPPLYLSTHESVLKSTSSYNSKYGLGLRKFSDLGIVDNTENNAGNISNDSFFNKLSEILFFEVSEDLENAEFIFIDDDLYYNTEYFKCIITSIIFDAFKNISHNSDDYLLNIISLKKERRRYEQLKHFDSNKGDIEKKRDHLTVKFYREKGDKFDYLVIEHFVSKIKRQGVKSDKYVEMKLLNSLDFANDGHISLLTIKGYIEGISSGDQFSEIIDKFCINVSEREDDNGFTSVLKLPVLRSNE